MAETLDQAKFRQARPYLRAGLALFFYLRRGELAFVKEGERFTQYFKQAEEFLDECDKWKDK